MCLPPFPDGRSPISDERLKIVAMPRSLLGAYLPLSLRKQLAMLGQQGRVRMHRLGATVFIFTVIVLLG